MNKILIVDDEADMCLLLNILLADKNITLDHVTSLSSASTYLESDQPTIVILDNKLPDGYGIDYIPALKKAYPDIRIIMISGFADAAKDLALHNGADVFLNKPFTKEQLYKSVKDLLN